MVTTFLPLNYCEYYLKVTFFRQKQILKQFLRGHAAKYLSWKSQRVKENHLSFHGSPNLSTSRFNTLSRIMNRSQEQKVGRMNINYSCFYISFKFIFSHKKKNLHIGTQNWGTSINRERFASVQKLLALAFSKTLTL